MTNRTDSQCRLAACTLIALAFSLTDPATASTCRYRLWPQMVPITYDEQGLLLANGPANLAVCGMGSEPFVDVDETAGPPVFFGQQPLFGGGHSSTDGAIGLSDLAVMAGALGAACAAP